MARISSEVTTPCSRPLTIRPSTARTRGLLEVVFELLASARVPKLPQRLRLDLANSFPCDPKSLPHLFKSSLVTVDQAKAQLQHAPLARGEGIEDILHLRPQHRQRGRV